MATTVIRQQAAADSKRLTSGKYLTTVREMDPSAVRQVRSFNRIVTERIGAVGDRFLQRRRPMNEARLLWEIGPDSAELRMLRARMGIDSGYLTRVLHSLEKQKLVKVSVSSVDCRVRCAYLTKTGLAERAELDRRSDALAESILEALSDRHRKALTAAMGEIERLLEASMVTFACAAGRLVAEPLGSTASDRLN